MIKIISEPVDQDCTTFINFVTSRCSMFSLVWNYEFVLDETTKTIYELLKGHLLAEEIIHNKRLIDKHSILPVLRKFLIDEESIRILKDSPAMFACPERESKASWRIKKDRKPGLFSWVSPCLPEDLVFYSKTGDVWLESVSHEEEYYLYEMKAMQELKKYLPSLKTK